MSVKISKVYGLDVYSDEGGYIGKVYDVILNMEKGAVIRLTTEPLKTVSKEEARRVLREKSFLYSRVRSVGDIMIISKRGSALAASEEEAAALTAPALLARHELGRTIPRTR